MYLIAIFIPIGISLGAITFFVYEYYKINKKNYDTTFHFYSKKTALYLTFIHAFAWGYQALENGFIFSFIATLGSFILCYLMASLCRFLSYFLWKRYITKNFPITIVKYEHQASDVRLLEDFRYTMRDLISLCHAAVYIKSSKSSDELSKSVKESHSIYLKLSEGKELITHVSKNLKKETPVTSEILKLFHTAFDKLENQMLFIEKIYTSLLKGTTSPIFYDKKEYFSDKRKLSKSNKEIETALSCINYYYKVLVQDIEQAQEQDDSLQNKVYKISVMLCNPKNEKSIDIFYSRFDSDFNWDKRCLAIKSLLDIIDESEELEPLLEEFDLGCDEDTLSLFEEIMSFLQGLGLDWQNDKYIPVEVMLNYKALSFILENDIVKLPELNNVIFPTVLLDFMSLLRSENILGTNDLYTTK